MLAKSHRTGCSDCRAPISGRIEKTGLVTGLLLAVVPKCPFCFVAFSATAVLCGEGGVTTTAAHSISSTPAIVLSAVMCLIVLSSVILNYHSSKTPKALLVLVPAVGAVLTSVLWKGGEALYYSGLSAMFLGVWMNGSFSYFAARIRRWWHGQAASDISAG